MIIDIRCRYITEKDAKYFDHSNKRIVVHDNPESYIAWLDDREISVALSPTAANHGLKLGRWDLPPRTVNNEMQAEMQQRFPKRFVGVAGIDPSNEIHDAAKELDRCFHELKLKVATIEPGRDPMRVENLADERLYEFYAHAESLDVPVILQTSGLKGGLSIDYAHPRWIDKIAEDFPKLHLICAHGCAPYHRELALVTRRRPNVFASPDLYSFLDFKSVQWTQGEQLIFASGYPYVGVEWMKQGYFEAPWVDTQLDDIMFKNAIRALKLDKDPYFESKLKLPQVFQNAKIKKDFFS